MKFYKCISVKEAKEILNNDENTILIDVRDSDSYNEEHDPNAIHVTTTNMRSFMKETDKEMNILILCYLGNTSMIMAQLFCGQGFSNVYSIDGGYEAWRSKSR